VLSNFPLVAVGWQQGSSRVARGCLRIRITELDGGEGKAGAMNCRAKDGSDDVMQAGVAGVYSIHTLS
jgi:hypothetical protein